MGPQTSNQPICMTPTAVFASFGWARPKIVSSRILRAIPRKRPGSALAKVLMGKRRGFIGEGPCWGWFFDCPSTG